MIRIIRFVALHSITKADDQAAKGVADNY